MDASGIHAVRTIVAIIAIHLCQPFAGTHLTPKGSIGVVIPDVRKPDLIQITERFGFTRVALAGKDIPVSTFES